MADQNPEPATPAQEGEAAPPASETPAPEAAAEGSGAGEGAGGAAAEGAEGAAAEDDDDPGFEIPEDDLDPELREAMADSLGLTLEEYDAKVKAARIKRGTAKKELTEEEKAAKIAEMKQKMKARREQDKVDVEKKERDAERRRVEMGRDMAKIREERRKQDMENAEREHKRKKAEEAASRARVNEKLLKDKRERLGGAEVDRMLREEEEAKQKLLDLRKNFAAIVTGMTGEKPAIKKCLETLTIYIENAWKKPEEEKFLKINTENKGFQSRVASVPGAVDYLKAAGFKPEEGLLTLKREEHDPTLLQSAFTELKVQLLHL